jgi:hypothetical protein
METETDREIRRQPDKRKNSPEDVRDDRSQLIVTPDIPPAIYFRERMSVANQTCWYMGFFLVAIGVVGFVVPDLWEFHLSFAHNMVNAVAGILTLWVGLTRKAPTAKRFAFWFGMAYFLFGASGYFFGQSLFIDGAERARYYMVLIPDKFELGRWDHYLHAAVGLVLMAGGFISRADWHTRRKVRHART